MSGSLLAVAMIVAIIVAVALTPSIALAALAIWITRRRRGREYVPGFGWIDALPGSLPPRPDALRQQDARQQQAKGHRGGVGPIVQHDSAGAA